MSYNGITYVNGLLSKIDDVRQFAKNEKIDTFAINETKIDDKVKDQPDNIDGFDLKRLDRDRHVVGLHCKPGTRMVLNSVMTLICIEIEPPNASPFIIVSWYRPPSVRISCFESLKENICFLDREKKEIISLGDTNCDFSLPRPFDANYSSHLQEIYDLFGLRQLITEPTRITLHSS